MKADNIFATSNISYQMTGKRLDMTLDTKLDYLNSLKKNSKHSEAWTKFVDVTLQWNIYYIIKNFISEIIL